jgi:hypothetical protein
MFNSVEEYLAALRKELSGSDRATIQDALSDAEEYLRTALSNVPAGNGTTDAGLLVSVIGKYGTPAEVAAAYRQIESHTPSAIAALRNTETPAEPARPALREGRPFYARFFGIFAEPRAWGSFLYLLFTLATGIIYFTWVVTGISLSFGLLVLVIGLPVAGLFLLSVRGIALIEGRLVEALLGVRMPRRPRFAGKTGIWQQFKNLITDKHTWFSMVYMLLQMPLGIIYFSLFVTLLSVALALVAWPIVAIAMGLPVFVIASHEYYATGLLIPISIVAGALLLTGTMHLAKATGRAHGEMAKTLLVRP